MIRRVQFISKTKEAPRQRVLEMPGDITQYMGVHGYITGKMIMRFICLDHITITTTPLSNQ